MDKNPFAWNNDWMGFQRSYLDAFSALSPQNKSNPWNVNTSSSSTNPWTDALDSWWKSVAPTASSPVQDFYSKIIEQGKSYFQMNDQLTQAFQASAAAGQSVTQWQDAINNMLNSMKDGFMGTSDKGQDAAQKMMGFWELPVDHWQSVLSSMSATPGDFLQGLNTTGLNGITGQMQGQIDQFLSTPAVGQMRERQGQYQELIKLSIDYQNAQQEYMKASNEIGLKSVEHMQKKVLEVSNEGQEFNSMRAFYDLWVDCCEEVYADYVMTDEYVEIHGNLVNSLMKLKQHGRMMVDGVLAALNMPSRAEMNTLHSRFQQMRRENKNLQVELQSLKEQVMNLSRTVPATKTSTSSSTKAKKPASKTKKTKTAS